MLLYDKVCKVDSLVVGLTVFDLDVTPMFKVVWVMFLIQDML